MFARLYQYICFDTDEGFVIRLMSFCVDDKVMLAHNNIPTFPLYLIK